MNQQLEVLEAMQGTVAENLSILGDVGDVWQPTDYLPDLTGADWVERVRAYRDASEGLSDDLLVVLVGDMVTEEALPSYAVSLDHFSGGRDESGAASQTPWAKWLRGWTAEENRHGDLLNAYLRLTGRVSMRDVEVTVNHLLANGFDPQINGDAYGGLIYTAFQERATKVSHRNVGRLAKAQGDTNLSRICARIAGDESRHELFYTRLMDRVLDLDPEGGMLSIGRMFRKQIAMPGERMVDGHDPDLFDHFAAIAQRTEVYTVYDYADIMDHLVERWSIAKRSVSGKAAKAQDYICDRSRFYRHVAERYGRSLHEKPAAEFRWLSVPRR